MPETVQRSSGSKATTRTTAQQADFLYQTCLEHNFFSQNTKKSNDFLPFLENHGNLNKRKFYMKLQTDIPAIAGNEMAIFDLVIVYGIAVAAHL